LVGLRVERLAGHVALSPCHGRAPHNADTLARRQRKANDARHGVRRFPRMRHIPRHTTHRCVPSMARGGSSIGRKENTYPRIHDIGEYRGPSDPFVCSSSGSCHRCRYCRWPHKTNRRRYNLDIVVLIVERQYAFPFPPPFLKRGVLKCPLC